MAIEIQRKCEACNGLGEIVRSLVGGGTETVACPDCGGSGSMLFASSEDLGTALSDLTDKVNDIKQKVDEIKEVVDGL